MVNFIEDNADSEIYSNELKKQAGFGKDGEKGFDGAITNLMMQTFILNFFIDQAGTLHMYRLPLCNGKSIAVK